MYARALMLAALLALLFAFAAPAATAALSPTAEVETLLSTHGFGRPVHDPRLDAVSARLTERLSGAPGDPMPAGAADFLNHALSVAQVSDAQVFPFTLRHRAFGDFAARLPAFLGRLDRTKPPTHYGLATFVKGGNMTTTLLLAHRGVTLNHPLPRQSEPGAWIPLQGDLLRGYFRPRVLISPPGGARIVERPAWTSERKVDTSIWFDAGPGVYGVEVVADSQYGPVVLNNAEVSVGVPVSDLPITRLEPGGVDGPPAMALFRLVNEQRAAHGVAVLRLWPDLAAVAQDYAVELDDKHVLVHATAASGNLATRLQTRGLRFTLAAENLADAVSPRQALAAFMASPGHKRNLLDPALTHVGVGVVGRYFVLAMVRMGP
jgi:hypothetical protein